MLLQPVVTFLLRGNRVCRRESLSARGLRDPSCRLRVTVAEKGRFSKQTRANPIRIGGGFVQVVCRVAVRRTRCRETLRGDRCRKSSVRNGETRLNTARDDFVVTSSYLRRAGEMHERFDKRLLRGRFAHLFEYSLTFRYTRSVLFHDYSRVVNFTTYT